MLLSIIVIEYNSMAEIIFFAKQVKEKLNAIDYELIVSSNSCYKPSQQDAIREQYPEIRWQFNPENGGFAYGMNHGIGVAKGEYILISNPDVILKKGIREAIAYLQSNPDVGIIGPCIRDEQGTVQDSFRKYVTMPVFIVRQMKRILQTEKPLEIDETSEPIEIDWVIGASMLARRTVLEKVQGFDQHYFMYSEDIDLCTRIRHSGYKIVYLPKFEVEYKGTRSARRSWKYAKIFIKSHLYLWRKHGLLREKK